MYKIIGGDGNEYGPVSAEMMRQWLAENRVNAATKVRTETGEWQTLADFPELVGAAQAAPQPSGVPPPFGAAPASFAPAPRQQEIYEGDYQLDMGGCIARGWELIKANFGLLFAVFMSYVGLQFLAAVLGMIPIIGVFFSMANWVVTGPLMGGLFYVYLRVIRGLPTQAGDVFEGFRRSFGQLFLAQLVTGLFGLVCLLPALVTAVILLLPTILHHAPEPPMPQLIIIGAVFFVCLLPMIYLQMNFMFALPLILDKGLDFWSAMKLSWRRVTLHWWQCFGLAVLVGLLNVAGLLACCVGVFIAMPVGFAAMMYAYETIFSGADAPAA